MTEARPPTARSRGGFDPASWGIARTALLLYLVALAAVLLYGLLEGYRASPRLLDADEREYWDMASDLLAGRLHLTARRTLGFPLFLAIVRAGVDDVRLVQVVTSAVYALTPPLLFVLVRRLSGSMRAGVLAGLALALWPPAVFFGGSLYSETLAAPVFVGALAALPAPRSVRWAIMTLAAGMLLGLATHVRPMYLLFLPCLALILLIEERSLVRALARFAVALAGFGIVILPWSAAMTARFDHPILVTANGGETLAGGLNPGLLRPAPPQVMRTPSGRQAWAGPGKWVPVEQTGYLTPADQRLPYDAQDRLLRARTWAWIAGHPLEVLHLEACKLGYMWGLYGFDQNTTEQVVLGDVPTLVLLALALWAGMTGPGWRFRLARLWLLPLFVSGIALISWGSWRFRQPGDIGLIGFVSVALVRRIERRGYPFRPEGAGSAR